MNGLMMRILVLTAGLAFALAEPSNGFESTCVVQQFSFNTGSCGDTLATGTQSCEGELDPPEYGEGSGSVFANSQTGLVGGFIQLEVTGTSQTPAMLGACFFASQKIEDIIFEGPGDQVPAELNISFHGDVDYSEGGPKGAYTLLVRFGNQVKSVEVNDSTSQTVITEPVEVPTDQPLVVEIVLRGQAAIGAVAPLTRTLTADFSRTASFPRTGPVFNLPEGFTVNSVEGGIVDNRYVPDGTVGTESVTWSEIKGRYIDHESH